MYENDTGIILFRNYDSWQNLKPKKYLYNTERAKFQNILLP